MLGHVARFKFDADWPIEFLYLSCINKCFKAKRCLAITFDEIRRQCWLKSSESHVRRITRTFVEMKCLKQPGKVLYDGFKGLTLDGTPTYAGYTCPRGYENWISSSFYCYNVFSDFRPLYASGANMVCSIKGKGQLAQIDSEDLNIAFAQKIGQSIFRKKPVFIEWQYRKINRSRVV